MESVDAGLSTIAALVADGDVVVLSGAGLSTESGIPDYRGPTGRARAATPMTYQEFTASAQARRRYWARAHAGWSTMRSARPNAGHQAVAALEGAGLITAVITQNVDGLHRAAGSSALVELHGTLHQVRCLDCGERGPRTDYDRRLAAANPGFAARIRSAYHRSDGDADVADAAIRSFRVPGCATCGGRVKPDVVFFGENVPPERVARSYALVEDAGLLLVLGSSLTVMSGYRFVRHAAALGIPVAIINQGATRGDRHALVTLDAPLGPTLHRLCAAVGYPAAATESSARSATSTGISRSVLR